MRTSRITNPDLEVAQTLKTAWALPIIRHRTPVEDLNKTYCLLVGKLEREPRVFCVRIRCVAKVVEVVDNTVDAFASAGPICGVH